MNLETVIQIEVSHNRKKISIVMHICGIYKKWYKLTYFQSRNRDTGIDKKMCGY